MRATFTTELQLVDGKNTGIEVPTQVVASFGAGKRPPVLVTVGDYSYRSTVAPMGGSFWLPFAAERRAATGLKGGEQIEVTLELDNEPRTVDVPDDLAQALEEGDARTAFDSLSYSKRLAAVTSVLGAKARETRDRRIGKVVESLASARQTVAAVQHQRSHLAALAEPATVTTPPGEPAADTPGDPSTTSPSPATTPGAVVPPPPPIGAWAPDFLGHGHEAQTLQLADDFEGEVFAALVRYRPTLDDAFPLPLADLPTTRYAVLYLHGWSDYLMNPEIGPFWAAQGGAFYGLDLRKYGRALREHQSHGYVDNLATYDEDIDAALATIAEDHPGLPVVLMAHSTGGLTASLWADRNPGRLAALVLVAPWLETQGSTMVRSLSSPVIREVARHFPLNETPNPDLGYYFRTVSSRLDGEWDLVEAWRPEHGFAERYGWLSAVLDGHGRIAEGLSIDVPILVLRSSRSLISPVWGEDMARSDVVIDVQVIAERALGIGHTVTVATIQDALHDVLLSAPAVREEAYRQMAQWGRAYLP